MKLEFSVQIFEKSSKCQVLSKSVQWEQSSSMQMDRQTVGYDEANSRFSKFCKWA